MATKGLQAVDHFAARMGMERRLEYDEVLKGLASPDKWPTVGEHVNRDGIMAVESFERGYLREGSFMDHQHQARVDADVRDGGRRGGGARARGATRGHIGPDEDDTAGDATHGRAAWRRRRA